MWGAIFDWDGVIVDSSIQHEKSWDRLAAEAGYALPEGHFERSFGMKNQRIIPEILEWTQDAARIQDLSDRKEILYREILMASGIEPLPGVDAWLGKLRDAEVPCVVGSSTDRLNITTVLDLWGWEDRFVSIVSSEDVAHGKPDPEVFQKAAQCLGLGPEQCLVFEDAPVGLAAARASGMRVIAVTSTRPAEALAGADLVVDRLDQLSVEQLSGWFEAPVV